MPRLLKFLILLIIIIYFGCNKDRLNDIGRSKIENNQNLNQRESEIQDQELTLQNFIDNVNIHIYVESKYRLKNGLNSYNEEYGFPMFNYISVHRDNNSIVAIKLPLSKTNGEVRGYYLTYLVNGHFIIELVLTNHDLRPEMDFYQEDPVVSNIRTYIPDTEFIEEEEDDSENGSGGSGSNSGESGNLRTLCYEEQCPIGLPRCSGSGCCRHPRKDCSKRNETGNGGGGSGGGSGGSSGGGIIIWNDRGTIDWGGPEGPRPGNPGYGGNNGEGKIVLCVFTKEELNKVLCDYLASNYPEVPCPSKIITAIWNYGCLNEVCIESKTTGIKNLSLCVEKAAEEIVKRFYGITEEEFNCVKGSISLIEKISELKASGLKDPCHPEKNSEQLIAEILFKSCNLAGDKLENFLNELNETDWIQFYDNFKNNKRLQCIFEKIISNNTNLYCKTLVNFEGVSSISLRLDYQSFKKADGTNDYSRDGITTIDNQGQILIQLNSNNLDGDGDWNAVQTILHEGIHANIAKIFFDYSSSQIAQNYPLMFSYFQDYKNTTWDWEHEYMANEMIDELITSLKEVFGANYTDEEYEYMGWGGLKNTDKWINHTHTTEKNRIDAHKTSIDSKNVKICP